MKTRSILMMGLILGFVLAAPASALIIDDFSVGGTSLSLADTDINKWDLETGLASPAVYKGKRYTQLDWQPVTNGGAGDSASIKVNDGGSGIADFTKVGDPRWWFGYGLRAFDLTWDEDFSGSDKDRLKITFGGAGAPETIKIYFYLHGSGGIAHYLNDKIVFSPGQSVGFYTLMGSINPQGVDVDALREHVTGMAVYYVGAENTDTSNWSLEKVELVPIPEPLTLSVMSIGGLAVLIRSRRK
ncbi:hypothetical protein LCGC14_0017880 [marine sediment metagenome]|uniref:PEP-CTERM protein-sorting domain-containing protein n=1 Tax=marine sediment metagenome TaxID=412755 RepID=A0A0F9WFU7_9ZZZZ|nr:hypothetical protein [Phycisphaerae bacterium]